ncbi:MAG: HupE/UreJ family protein [Clostridia bacterium]|nr:HupE/UreJ family protein [Deltaproteobacteria bacterium]
MKRAAICVVMLLIGRTAIAHPLDLGYLKVDATDSAVAVSFDIAASTAARLIDMEPLEVSSAVIQKNALQLANAIFGDAPSTDTGPCRWGNVSAELLDQTVRLSAMADCFTSGHHVRWSLPFLHDAKIPSTYQLLVRARLFGTEHITTLDRDHRDLDLSGNAQFGFLEFTWMGIEHIGAAPSEWHNDTGLKIPDGIDHIVFIIALLLGGGTLLHLGGVVSGFTLGHSITLTLAAFGIVQVSQRVIEPLIALTIMAAASESVFGILHRHRWKVAAGFGFLHGLGLASALTSLELTGGKLVKALLGYNMGVEVGQLCIVVAAVPLLVLLRKKPRVERYVVRLAAAVIFGLGSYWFIERLSAGPH